MTIRHPGHPWGHGSDATRAPITGEVFDCGHKPRGRNDGPLLYGTEWVCLACAVERCPVCGPAGRNVTLDGTVLAARFADPEPLSMRPVTDHGTQGTLL